MSELAKLREQIKGLTDHNLDPEDLVGDEGEFLELVEDEGFSQDHKYQNRTTILKSAVTGQHYAYHQSRSGSPFSDWHYGEASIDPVKKKLEIKEVVSWVSA